MLRQIRLFISFSFFVVLLSILYFLFADVNECLQNPCSNSVACQNVPGSYTCVCNPGWKGQDCDIGRLMLIRYYGDDKLRYFRVDLSSIGFVVLKYYDID